MALPTSWSSFENIWAVDFEFVAPDGEPPTAICGVARNLRSGELRRIGANELVRSNPPYGVGPSDLFIAYYAAAELSCHLQLFWPLPTWIVDLYVEFRLYTNGRDLPCGRSLLGACQYFGLPFIDSEHKTRMRQLAMRGGPWTAEEQTALLEYCQSDVDMLAALFARLQPHLDLPRAIWRARYMAACARMEQAGIPIDVPMLETLRASWDRLKTSLIAQVDASLRRVRRPDLQTRPIRTVSGRPRDSLGTNRHRPSQTR